ncbi:hypothetical protein ICI42_12885 [Tianweitania sp. Rool2]|uniref:Uncharacterized protein n=1 Tax=Oryzicola mucosus TaxID=2767425 RepID=A0A8J6U286_9HYPH|nr:hypothetical protein [Oryzicola mucosus]MBD0415558.1 hypothetical protein [Oryzicola mucosus]
MLGELLRDAFGIDANNISINRDRYSLNSLNGFFDTGEGQFFFKFHQEEGEEEMSGEYYRADILARAKLPVDLPVLSSVLPGEQILVYRRRSDPRFSDVLRALDLSGDPVSEAKAIQAEADLSDALLAVYLQSLHPITPEQSAAEPVHRLFYERLIEPLTGKYPGGRLLSFYIDKDFAFPGVELDWQTLASAHFVVNGVRYGRTLGQLFDEAAERLNPRRLADAGGVIAHGDAHNANVWYSEHPDGTAALSFFDPAFAGEHVPTLLAEVKTTFHNMLAHPLWLYDPADAADTWQARAEISAGDLIVTTDFALSRIRLALMDVKAQRLWKPLLATLAERGMLPDDWRRVVRLGLFLCPTLVMNLRAGAGNHNEVSSLIGLSVAVMAGSEPDSGDDVVSRFLDAIDPHQGIAETPSGLK